MRWFEAQSWRRRKTCSTIAQESGSGIWRRLPEPFRSETNTYHLPSPTPNPSTPHFPSSPKQKSAMTRPITLQNL